MTICQLFHLLPWNNNKTSLVTVLSYLLMQFGLKLDKFSLKTTWLYKWFEVWRWYEACKIIRTSENYIKQLFILNYNMKFFKSYHIIIKCRFHDISGYFFDGVCSYPVWWMFVHFTRGLFLFCFLGGSFEHKYRIL